MSDSDNRIVWTTPAASGRMKLNYLFLLMIAAMIISAVVAFMFKNNIAFT